MTLPLHAATMARLLSTPEGTLQLVPIGLVMSSWFAASQQPASAPTAAETAPAVAASSSLSPSLAGGRRKVIVLEFVANGVPAEVARTVTNLVAVELSKRPDLDVVSAADIRTSLALEEVGCTESDCLAELAGAVGAGEVVHGDVARLGDEFLVTVHFFDVAQSQSRSRVSIRADREVDLPRALRAALNPRFTPLFERIPFVGGAVIATVGLVTAASGGGGVVATLAILNDPASAGADKELARTAWSVGAAVAAVGAAITLGGAVLFAAAFVDGWYPSAE